MTSSNEPSTDTFDGELTILLVEDNDAHAELVKRGMEDHAIPNRIVHVPDGQAAIDYLFGDVDQPGVVPSRPDVVLLDLRLPKVDRFEVLSRIRESDNLRRLPVVVLSTSEAARDIGRAYDGRANSYLVKPMAMDGFTDLMNEFGSYWLSRNRSPWT